MLRLANAYERPIFFPVPTLTVKIPKTFLENYPTELDCSTSGPASFPFSLARSLFKFSIDVAITFPDPPSVLRANLVSYVLSIPRQSDPPLLEGKCNGIFEHFKLIVLSSMYLSAITPWRSVLGFVAWTLCTCSRAS